MLASAQLLHQAKELPTISFAALTLVVTQLHTSERN
jgi:hypothetical protein